MLAGLVARHVVVMRDLETVPAHVLDARDPELAPVRIVRREDAVVGIDDDHRLRILLEIRDERAHVGMASRRGAGTIGMVSCGFMRTLGEGVPDELPGRLPILPRHCQTWQSAAAAGAANTRATLQPHRKPEPNQVPGGSAGASAHAGTLLELPIPIADAEPDRGHPVSHATTLSVEGFFDPATHTVSYLLLDTASRACADRQRARLRPTSGRTHTASADRLIARVAELGADVHWLLETHVHADHLSAAPYRRNTSAAGSRSARTCAACSTCSARCSTRWLRAGRPPVRPAARRR